MHVALINSSEDIVRSCGNSNRKSVAEMTTPALKVYATRVSNNNVLLNVPNGQVVLQMSIVNALVATSGIDTPYYSGTGTVAFNSPTTSNIFVYTYYFDPISVPGVDPQAFPGSIPVPYEDLQLVHEVRSITVPNMLSASAESIYSFMSGRDYYRVIASVVDGSSSGPNGTAGAMLTSRIARTRFVYDGNTPRRLGLQTAKSVANDENCWKPEMVISSRAA